MADVDAGIAGGSDVVKVQVREEYSNIANDWRSTDGKGDLTGVVMGVDLFRLEIIKSEHERVVTLRQAADNALDFIRACVVIGAREYVASRTIPFRAIPIAPARQRRRSDDAATHEGAFNME